MFVDIINVKLLYGKKTYPERAVLVGSGVSMLMQKYYIFLILTIFPKKSDKYLINNTSVLYSAILIDIL